MSWRNRIAASVSSLCIAGCSITYTEVGADLPELIGIEVGVTTKGRALALLGPPTFVQRQFDGELYTWRVLRGENRSLTLLPVFVRLFYWEDGKTTQDDVALLFDTEGILRGAGRTSRPIDSRESADRPAP